MQNEAHSMIIERLKCPVSPTNGAFLTRMFLIQLLLRRTSCVQLSFTVFVTSIYVAFPKSYNMHAPHFTFVAKEKEHIIFPKILRNILALPCSAALNDRVTWTVSSAGIVSCCYTQYVFCKALRRQTSELFCFFFRMSADYETNDYHNMYATTTRSKTKP